MEFLRTQTQHLGPLGFHFKRTQSSKPKDHGSMTQLVFHHSIIPYTCCTILYTLYICCIQLITKSKTLILYFSVSLPKFSPTMLCIMSSERCAKYLLWLLLVAILLFHASKIECCIHEEMHALLEIKAYLKSYRDQNPLYADSDTPWSENGQRYNCCAWDMVVCNMSTGRVTKLGLSGMAYFAQDATQKPWLFNVTLFRPFRQLIDLDLSYNSINGLVESDGNPMLLISSVFIFFRHTSSV